MSTYVFIFILIQLLLLVPSYYFYCFLLKRMGVASVKTFSLVFTVTFAILFTFIFIEINSQYIHPYIRSAKFDSYKWKTQSEHRYKMTKDIIERKILIGKSPEAVTQLLGKDFEKGPCEECMGYSTYEPDEGFSIDHEVLQINFEKNKVVNVALNSW